MKKRLTKKQKKCLIYEIIGRIFVRLSLFVICEIGLGYLGYWAFLQNTIY